MDHGEKLLEGDYDTVVRDPQVIEAYLGKSDA
jgi:ABC-type branched-subunit amino acid transport system ATPase component